MKQANNPHASRPRRTTHRSANVGFALSLTLYVVFAVLLAGMTLATLATFNINLSLDSRLRDEAFDAANSGLSLAIYNLTVNPKWGTSTSDKLGVSTIPPVSVSLPSGGTATLQTADAPTFNMTFSPSAATPNLPWSVNNLANASTVVGPPDSTGNPRTVPAFSALLFVQGTAGINEHTRSRVVEALIQFPPCLFAIAASNAVASWKTNACGGGFRWCCCTAGGYSAGAYRTKIDACPPCCPAGGSVFAGGSIDGGYCASRCVGVTGTGNVGTLGSTAYGDESVYLAPWSKVTGTVVRTGNTNVVPFGWPCAPSNAPLAKNVEAACTQTGSSNQTVPVINISSFNNQSTATYTYTGGSVPTSLTGSIYISGAATLGTAAAPVSLNNVTMFVNGDLNIPYGVTGPGGYASGSIFVNGKVTVGLTPPPQGGNSVTFAGTQGIAIFAQDDLIINTVGATGSCQSALSSAHPTLWGTLYSHGNVTLTQGIHIVGSVVAAAETSSNVTTATTAAGNVFLNAGVEVTYYPQYSQFGSLSSTSNFNTQVLQSQNPDNASLMKICYWREVQ